MDEHRALRGIALGSLFGLLFWVGAGGAIWSWFPHNHQALADGVCVETGWHAPTTHEHGDQPPQWVAASQWPPFTQCREGHTGYKGAYSRDLLSSGVEAYLITHVLSTPGARSHGDHDYQLWLREPNGIVSHWGRDGSSNTSIMNFGIPTPLLLTTKTDDRPSIQDVTDNETWYAHPSFNVFDARIVIYGANQPFGAIPTGDGAIRNTVWSVDASRFPGPDARVISPSLAARCSPVPGKSPACVFSFETGTVDYAPRDAKGNRLTMQVPN